MRLRNYILLCLLTLSVFSATGQENPGNWCGTKGDSPWLDWYQRNSGLFNHADGGSDTAWLYVPLTLHLVGTDAGTHHYQIDQAFRNICEMNESYIPARIHFYLKPGDPVRRYNKTSWFKHDWSGGEEMILTATAGLEDRLNVFTVNDPAGNCGYSWYDAVVMGTQNGCSNPGNMTWSHEAGHHFSLPHPFRGWEDFTWNYNEPAPSKVNNRDVEKTDGSNCYVGGDRFCDTEPDYLNYRWECDQDSRSKKVQHDPDNVAFRSDATLIMGYALDGCSNRFTEEQIAAMRANLRDEHKSYLQINQPLSSMEIDDHAQVTLISPIDTSESVQFNHIELKWNPVPGAKYYTVELATSKSFSARFFYQTFENTTSTIVTKNVPNNWTVYWRVRAYNEWDICQPYDQAQIGVFRTQNLSATNELERSATFDLAPNPVFAGAPAHLNISADKSMEILVQVSDAAGRICFRQQTKLVSGQNQFDIPTEQLSTGMYTILIQNEKGATIKRLAVVE